MKEEITIDTIAGPLEILGGKQESALLLNGVPIQFTYLREMGTTERYVIGKSVSETTIIQEAQFRDFVRHGLVNDEPLSTQFSYIIDKLSTGKYHLELGYIDARTYLLKAMQTAGYYHFDTYGGTADILQTQADYSEAVVKSYSELLAQGCQPIVISITSEGAASEFILDGHHKYLAYSRLKKPARVLRIIKLDARPIDKSLGLQLLDLCQSCNAEYRNRFLDE